MPMGFYLIVTVYPIEVAFSKSCPRIVVEIKDAVRTEKRADVLEKTEIETRTLTEEEKEKLTTGNFCKKYIY